MLIRRVKKYLSGTYIHNVGWMAGAEIAHRFIRLASTVILARVFTPEDYGLMAMIYTIFDFFQVFTMRGGVGAKIIQADDQDVYEICNTAYWLNWICCVLLFIVQSLAALVLSYFSEGRPLALPLFVVAFIYLTYPLFAIHLTLIERENRFKATAICNVSASLVASTITASFALMGMGIWSIVCSLISMFPVWIILAWKFHPWRPPLRFNINRWREVVGFGSSLLMNELLNKLRTNIDYLIVGRYLGVQALGLYYFAFNAGSGITTSLLNTFMSPMYPYICAVKNNYSEFKERYFKSLKKVTFILVPIILLQASLAPIYVPIVFGEKWVIAIPVLILICLSVIPLIYNWAAGLLLNSINKPKIPVQVSLVSTTIFIISLLIVVKYGIVWVAATVLLNQAVVSSIFTIWMNKFALQEKHFLRYKI